MLNSEACEGLAMTKGKKNVNRGQKELEKGLEVGTDNNYHSGEKE